MDALDEDEMELRIDHIIIVLIILVSALLMAAITFLIELTFSCKRRKSLKKRRQSRSWLNLDWKMHRLNSDPNAEDVEKWNKSSQIIYKTSSNRMLSILNCSLKFFFSACYYEYVTYLLCCTNCAPTSGMYVLIYRYWIFFCKVSQH